MKQTAAAAAPVKRNRMNQRKGKKERIKKTPVPYILTRTQLPHLVRAINCFIMYLFSYIEYFIHFDGKSFRFFKATTKIEIKNATLAFAVKKLKHTQTHTHERV